MARRALLSGRGLLGLGEEFLAPGDFPLCSREQEEHEAGRRGARGRRDVSHGMENRRGREEPAAGLSGFIGRRKGDGISGDAQVGILRSGRQI